MTASIDFTTEKKMIENKIIRTSIKAVDYHIKRIDECFDQLERIHRFNVSNKVKNQALTFLKKQDKLMQIAKDLKSRFQSLQPLRITNSEKPTLDYDLDQLMIELDLLNDMHFSLKQTYFAFLNKYTSHRPQTLLMIA